MMLTEIATALITTFGWQLLGAVARLLPTSLGMAWVLAITGLFLWFHHFKRTPSKRLEIGPGHPLGWNLLFFFWR